MQSAVSITRRFALRCALLAGSLPLGARQDHPLGLALYTVRDGIVDNPNEVLKLTAEIGYREVEILRYQIALATAKR